MNYTTLACDCDDGILTVTLNRPDKLNAFTATMGDELVELFTRVNDDDTVRAVVVTGAGRAFCAGMDLDAGSSLDFSRSPTLDDMYTRLHEPSFQHGVRDGGGRVVLAIHACLKPVIAAINGVAVGVGATMTLPMDIRLVAEGARIGFVFGRIGIVPEACSSWFLPRIVGLSQALEWSYTAELIDAATAREAGLVKAVVPAADLLAEAQKLARRCTAQRSAVGIAMTRQLLYRNAAQPHPLEAHRSDSLAVFHLMQRDGVEGVRAFHEKRAPAFTSRVSTDMPEFFAEWVRRTDGAGES